MSPRPANEPDENEPDEDESPSTKTQRHTKTSTAISSSTLRHSGTTDPSSAISPPGSNDTSSSVPTSTIAPVIVALVVVVVLATFCIIYCSRLRKRINNEQRTSSINGWPSFMARFQTSQQHDDRRGPEMVPSAVDTINSGPHHYQKQRCPDPAAVQQHYLMSKPPPLEPIENGSAPRNNTSGSIIRLSSGCPYLSDSNKHEDLAISPASTAAHLVPAPLPGDLCVHDKTAQEDGNSNLQFKLMKPDEKT